MTVYVTHTCKNSKLKKQDQNYCFRAFMDEDLTNAKNIPPTWKYCPQCVAKGFVNPAEPPKKQLSEKQSFILKKYKHPNFNIIPFEDNEILPRKKRSI